MSQNELDMKRKEWNANVQSKPRHMLFGVDDRAQKAYVTEHMLREVAKVQERGEKIDQLVSKSTSYAHRSTPFGASSNTAVARPTGGGGFQSTGGAGLFAPFSGGFGGRGAGGGEVRANGQSASMQRFRRQDDSDEEEKSKATAEDDEMGFGFMDESPSRDLNSLVFEEGAWEESGMTTTYDVPGLKTLAPSNSTVRRFSQQILQISPWSHLFGQAKGSAGTEILFQC